MHAPDLSIPQRWLFAVKLPAWPKLIVPALLGHALAIHYAGSISVPGSLLGFGVTLFVLLHIVLLNDWGDRKIDALERERFPDSSPKTIPDGILPARQLLIAGLLAGLAAIAIGAIGLQYSREFLPFFALIGLGIFWLYTFPPVKLNYRGGGELLEAFGLGFVLPMLSYYAQSADGPGPEENMLLQGFALVCLAGAVASGLSDEESDRVGGKRTVATLFGNRFSRGCIPACLAVAALVWILAGRSAELLEPAWMLYTPAGLILLLAGWTQAASGKALTNAFREQAVYKQRLHLAIRLPVVVLSALLIYRGAFA